MTKSTIFTLLVFSLFACLNPLVAQSSDSTKPESDEPVIIKVVKLNFEIEKSPIGEEGLVVHVKNPMLIQTESIIYIYASDGKLLHEVKATDARMIIPRSVFKSDGIFYVTMKNELEAKTIPVLVN
jgi:hypothetical protein